MTKPKVNEVKADEGYKHKETVADFDFLGLIDLDYLHYQLIKNLEHVERAMSERRETKEFMENWNPNFPSEHLLTVPCDCMWCTTKIRGTMTWKRKEKK